MKELHPWDVYLSKRAHDIPWPAFFEAKFRRCTDKEVRFFFFAREMLGTSCRVSYIAKWRGCIL